MRRKKIKSGTFHYKIKGQKFDDIEINNCHDKHITICGNTCLGSRAIINVSRESIPELIKDLNDIVKRGFEPAK